MSNQVEKTESDKVNNGALFTLAAAGAAALVAIYLGVTALVRHQGDVIGEQRYAGADQDVQELRRQWTDKQSLAPHRDAKKGTIALPIELAMGVVVNDLKRDPNTATAAAPADAGVPDAALTGEDAGASATDDAGTEPAPAEGAAPEGQPAPEQPKPEGATEEAKPEEAKPEEKKKPKPRPAPVAPQPAAPVPAPAPAPAPAPPAGDSPY